VHLADSHAYRPEDVVIVVVVVLIVDVDVVDVVTVAVVDLNTCHDAAVVGDDVVVRRVNGTAVAADIQRDQ